MTNAERIVQVLQAAPGPVCDDCASVRASVFPRQQVFQIATRLVAAGQIARGTGPACAYCGGTKKVSTTVDGNSLVRGFGHSPTKPVGQPARELALSRISSSGGIDETRAWHWEGNVQAMLRGYLEAMGWTITAVANTATKENGIDLAAAMGKRELVVEVKGFPSTTYEHGERRGLPKPTQPTNQARQWYSHALLSIMRLREKRPAAEVALCFPDFPTYRKLIDSTRSSLDLLGVGVYLVFEDGGVAAHLAHRKIGSPS